MIIGDLEFYTLIRAYFAEMSEIDGVVVSPLFGQKRNVPITRTLYFEHLNGRVIDFSAPESEGDDNDFFVSDFQIDGRFCEMLTVRTKCDVQRLPELWAIRKQWIEGGIEPQGS